MLSVLYMVMWFDGTYRHAVCLCSVLFLSNIVVWNFNWHMAKNPFVGVGCYKTTVLIKTTTH